MGSAVSAVAHASTRTEFLGDESLATQDGLKLRDELMQQVYGPDLDKPKSGAEVLSVIEQMKNGPARDQALNTELSAAEFDAQTARARDVREAINFYLTHSDIAISNALEQDYPKIQTYHDIIVGSPALRLIQDLLYVNNDIDNFGAEDDDDEEGSGYAYVNGPHNYDDFEFFDHDPSLDPKPATTTTSTTGMATVAIGSGSGSDSDTAVSSVDIKTDTNADFATDSATDSDSAIDNNTKTESASSASASVSEAAAASAAGAAGAATATAAGISGYGQTGAAAGATAGATAESELDVDDEENTEEQVLSTTTATGDDAASVAAAYASTTALNPAGAKFVLFPNRMRFVLPQEILDKIMEIAIGPNTMPIGTSSTVGNKRNLSLSDISRYVFENYHVYISTMRMRNILRLSLVHVREWYERCLKPCYPIIYIDIEPVRMMTRSSLMVEHPFYVIMGMTFSGEHELLDIAPYPRDYTQPGEQEKMWLRCFTRLKERGLKEPVYMVTGPVQEFREALRMVFPHAIYQHSLGDIFRCAVENMTTQERANFTNDFRKLYNSKSLIECMKTLVVIEQRWKDSHPEAMQLIHDNFLFFEQYFAAAPVVRTSIRTTKVLGVLLGDVRRDVREDRYNFLYCDALHVVVRMLEVDRFITRNKRPVQWKRALKSMYEDSYIGKIIAPYIKLEDMRLSARSLKRDQVSFLTRQQQLEEQLNASVQYTGVSEEHKARKARNKDR